MAYFDQNLRYIITHNDSSACFAKKLLITVLVLFCFLSARPQKSADMGIRIGAAVYWGDLQNVSYGKQITPLYGVLGRWNFNRRMSIRGQLITGNLQSEGTFPGVNLAEPSSKVNPSVGGVPTELYLKKSDDSFNFKRSIQTFETIFEFNFMDYKMGSTVKDRFTPFLSLGLGVFYSRAPRQGTLVLMPQPTSIVVQLPQSNYNTFLPTQSLYAPLLDKNSNKTNDADALAPIIPIGFGFKYNLTKRLGMCMELCVRKTFTDNIDNLKDPKRFQNAEAMTSYPAQFAPSVFVNNDWYASLHLSLHWQVWADKGVCKVNDKNVKKSAF